MFSKGTCIRFPFHAGRHRMESSPRGHAGMLSKAFVVRGEALYNREPSEPRVTAQGYNKTRKKGKSERRVKFPRGEG